MLIGCCLLIEEVVEPHIDAQRINWIITCTYSKIGRDVVGNSLAVGIFTSCFSNLLVELILNGFHGIRNCFIRERRFSIFRSNAGFNKLDSQGLWQVTDTRELVYRLVLQAHTRLEFILRSKVPTPCFEVNAKNRCKAHACLVTVQFDV